MPAIYADTQFFVSSASGDCTIQIQNAITAAANTNTQVIFPAGNLNFSQPITLPTGFTGSISIGGLGRKVTKFTSLSGNNGFFFDLSSGILANNSVELFDFSLVNQNVVGGTALTLTYGTGKTYGTGNFSTVTAQPLSSWKNIGIYGGSWTGNMLLEGVFYSQSDALYIYGGVSTYTGINSGIGISLVNCTYNQFNRTALEFLGQGITMTNGGLGAAGDCQAISFNDTQIIECVEALHAYGTSGGAMALLKFDNWRINNLLQNLSGHRTVILENATACSVSLGQGLQNGGDSQIVLNNCATCIVESNNLQYRLNTVGPAIILTGTTNGCNILSNIFTGPIVFGSGTFSNYLNPPLGIVIDLGKNNTQGLTYSLH